MHEKWTTLEMYFAREIVNLNCTKLFSTDIERQNFNFIQKTVFRVVKSKWLSICNKIKVKLTENEKNYATNVW